LFFDKIYQAQELITSTRPELVENRPVYEAILQLYSDNALIETNIADLKEFLKHEKIEVRKTNAETFKECILNMLESFPELIASKGMLRYYETSPNFDWQACEKAEIIFGDALIQDAYGWQPDFWTVFEKEGLETICGLTVIAAFS
jgi:hypothetical protein